MNELNVCLFSRIDGKAQEGYLFSAIDGSKIDDIEMVYGENDEVLKEGIYSFDNFKKVVIRANIFHQDDSDSLKRSFVKKSECVLLQLKK